MEAKGAIVGAIICLLGLTVFIYGLTSMTQANAISNSFLIVIGIFLGISGLLLLMSNVFAGGSILT